MESGNLHLVDQNLPLVRLQEAHQVLEKDTLALAAPADHDENLPSGYLEMHTAKYPLPVEGLMQIVDLNHSS